MNVLAVLESALKGFDVGHMGDKAQFDLAVVRRQEHLVLVRDESGADFAAFFGTNWNVLEVGIGGRETAC